MNEQAPPIAAAHTADALSEHEANLRHLRHELRTPVNHIIGYSEMLLEIIEDEGPAELAPDLERVREAGKHLIILINDCLDPLRSDTYRADVELMSRDIHRTLDQVIEYILEVETAAVQVEQEDVLPDLEKIRTAASHLRTLVDDHAMTTIDQPAHIEAQVEPEVAPETSAAAHEHPYAAAHSIVHGIHFTDDQAGHIHAIPHVSMHGTLLVVDDNEGNRDMLSRRLERQGYAVAIAADGREALAMLGTASFDLVLLDIMMPELDGYDVLQQMKSNAATRDIPVIMISALDEIQSVVRCIELGAEDYLPKPFDPVLLRARIGASLEKKRLRDQELLYLQQVARLTAAASEVHSGTFDPETLADVAQRSDGLGQLASVFQHMAREVYAREQSLRQQLQELRIEIDQVKQQRQVAEITETDYFQQLRLRAKDLRRRGGQSGE